MVWACHHKHTQVWKMAYELGSRCLLLTTQNIQAKFFQIYLKLLRKMNTLNFQNICSSSFLSIPSRSNYRLYNNYLKWSMAQDAVNQSAAIIITTVRKAKKLSIPQEKWVYLHGYSNIEDTFVTHRPDISKSDAIV